MAAERLSMALGLNHLAIARSLGVLAGPDQQRRHAGQGAGQDWLQVQPLSDDVLEGPLYGRRCCYQEPPVRNRTKPINWGSASTWAYSGSPAPRE